MNRAFLLLALASVVLVLGHVIPSTPSIRSRLVAALGERLFAAVYSLFALAVLIRTVWAFRQAPLRPLWNPGSMHYVPLAIMPFAMILLVSAFLSRNPTSYGSGDLLQQGPVAAGMIRVTRHPFLWAVMLWAAVHILANGDLASLLFFGGYFALGAIGSVALDHKYAVRYGEAWDQFARQTSNIPLMAILVGRNRLLWREIGWRIPIAGIALYLIVLAGHPWLFGATPW
jgi:uncharacterized membrane protein